MKLWLVGQYKIDGETWEFQGVFDSEEKAIKACVNDMFFIAPITLNEELPLESAEMPKAYYPKHLAV